MCQSKADGGRRCLGRMHGPAEAGAAPPSTVPAPFATGRSGRDWAAELAGADDGQAAVLLEGMSAYDLQQLEQDFRARVPMVDGPEQDRLRAAARRVAEHHHLQVIREARSA